MALDGVGVVHFQPLCLMLDREARSASQPGFRVTEKLGIVG
jgi:hypothetical protein